MDSLHVFARNDLYFELSYSAASHFPRPLPSGSAGIRRPLAGELGGVDVMGKGLEEVLWQGRKFVLVTGGCLNDFE